MSSSLLETPIALAEEVVALGAVFNDMLCLEPNAGRGALVKPMVALGAHVTAVELNTEFYSDLLTAGCEMIYTNNFLTMVPSARKFDRVVMCPPFATNVAPQVDIDHVLHAWKFLKPGGRLVAIMSVGWTVAVAQKSKEFKRWVKSRFQWRCKKNPIDSFTKKSGAKVQTVTLILDKRERKRLS